MKADTPNIGELIRTLVSVIEEKDAFLRGHAQRVAVAAVNFARKIGMSGRDIDMLYHAGLLYDIGMVYIPYEILHKPGPLNEDEMAVVEQHPKIACKILSHIHFLKDALPIIYHHHEAYDGSGYPDRLRQDQIPVGARILSLADQYYALTSARAYRAAFTPEKAMEVMARKKDKFDPVLLADFLRFIQSTAKVQPDASRRKMSRKKVLEFAKVIVDRIKQGQIDIPVLPQIFNTVQEVIEDPNATPEDLAAAIQKDALISLRLIAAANSPVYRGSIPIKTVKEAIPRLGTKEVKEIVFAIASKSLYPMKDDVFKDLFDKIWMHSLASAYCAKVLARHLGRNNPDDYFTIGLSHDIGKVMFLRFLGKLGWKAKDDQDLADIITHLDEVNITLSGVILRHWRMNRDFVRAITFQDGTSFDKFTAKSVLINHLASHLADNIGYSIGNPPASMSSLKAAALLQLTPETVKEIGEEVAAIMQGVAHTF